MNCTNCGANNSVEQAQAGDCRYCGAALPHAMRAIEQEAVLQRLLEDRDGDGVPDGIQALEGLERERWRRDEEEAAREARAAALRKLADDLAAAQTAKVEPGQVAFFAFVAALILGVMFHLFVVRVYEQDPWLGAHHEVFCPMVCDGCRGPYVIFAWRAYSTPNGSSAESTRVYCRPKGNHFATYERSDFLIGLQANEEYELPGATYTLWLSSVPPLFLAMLPLMYIHARRDVRARRAEAPRLAALLEGLTKEPNEKESPEN